MKQILSSIEVLSQTEIEMINDAALKVLWEVGASIPNAEVIDLCEKNGAKVDKERQTIKISPAVMSSLIDEIRKRNFTRDQSKHGVKPMEAKISTQVFMYDYKSQTRRYGTLDDVMKGIALLETLESFKRANAVVIPADVPLVLADVTSFHRVLSYASKEGGTYILSVESAPYIIEMQKAMNRTYNYLLETISPLGYRRESLEIGLVFAKAGGALSLGPMVMSGATAPMSVAGTMVQGTAEILLSLFVNYSMIGKLCDRYCNPSHVMDPKTMLCSFGSPNQSLFAVASAQMGRFYGLKASSNSGLSDALMPDFQCGMEKSANLLFAMLAGCNTMGCMGIAGADQGLSMEQIVLDNEMFRMLNYTLAGFEVNEHSLGVEVIKETGIGGNFVCSKHTVDYLRSDYIQSEIFLREPWTEISQKELLDRAADYIGRVTIDYGKMTPVVSPAKYDELSYILAAAEKQLGKK